VPHIDFAFVEEHDEEINLLGVKGIGELPISGVAPAIASGIYHATGRRIRELPIRPEMLIQWGLQQRSSRKPRCSAAASYFSWMGCIRCRLL
jgi:hypothetical protein